MPNQKKKTATPESANGSASSEETSGEASTPGADLDSGTLPVEGKAWQIAQLAAQVLNVRGIYERGGDAQHTRDLEDNWRDERLLTRIKESVRTARSILEVVSIPLVDERIDASTLFKPGVAINATKIAKRFKDVGWKNMGETRLKVRLVEIDKCWTRLINEWESRALLSENYVENAIEKIAAAIRVLSLDQEVNHSIYKFEDETRLLMRRIRDHNPSIPGYPPVMASKLRSLHKWCFPGPLPEKPSTGEVYRIHELLRFAEEQHRKSQHYILPPAAFSPPPSFNAGESNRPHASDLPADSSPEDIPLQSSKDLTENSGAGVAFAKYVWLAPSLHPQNLASLTPPYNRQSFNSPPLFSDSFEAYNRQVMDPSYMYW